jgi:hypothetical protein
MLVRVFDDDLSLTYLLNPYPPSVTLTVAEDGVLSVILSAPTTDDMTFITANELVSLFPRLLRANECMIVARREDPAAHVIRLQDQGLRVVSRNEHWSRPCDAWCPMALRKTFGDKGIRHLMWHDYRRLRPRPSTASLKRGRRWLETMLSYTGTTYNGLFGRNATILIAPIASSDRNEPSFLPARR